MIQIVIAVGAVSAIGGTLALLLELAGKYFGEYGEVTLDINSGTKRMEVIGGASLLGTLRETGIFVPSACGGRGSCGACKVRVLEGGGPVLPTEAPFLNREERINLIRLSCQLKVRNEISIEIPEEIFNIKAWRARLVEKKLLAPDQMGLRFELLGDEPIRFRAGQYIQLLAPRYGKIKESVFRAYSIASCPTDSFAVDLIIQRVTGGIVSTWVHDYLETGDETEITGPYGDFYVRDTDREIIMIAAGSGMAPIISMLHAMVKRQCDRKAMFFFSARTRDELFHLELMKEFEEKLPNFTFVPTLTRASEEQSGGWSGKTGRVTALLPEMIGDRVKDAEAYLCGGSGLVEAAADALIEMGMPAERIHYDKFE